jgi:hypothetical protein
MYVRETPPSALPHERDVRYMYMYIRLEYIHYAALPHYSRNRREALLQKSFDQIYVFASGLGQTIQNQTLLFRCDPCGLSCQFGDLKGVHRAE